MQIASSVRVSGDTATLVNGIYDYQVHSLFSDGDSEVEEIVAAAMKAGAVSVCVTDHAQGWKEGTVNRDFFSTADTFRSYLSRLTELKLRYQKMGLIVLTGLEVEVSVDGILRLAPGILKVVGDPSNLHKFVDIVVGVIHSESFEEDKTRATSQDYEVQHLQNIKALISSQIIDIWGHPFQSLHGQFRRQYSVAERETIKTFLRQRLALGHPIAVECNLNATPHYEQWSDTANPYEEGALNWMDESFYLDILDTGVSIVVSSDAHTVASFSRYKNLDNINPILLEKIASR